MAATNTESHSFILLSTQQWNDLLNGRAAAKWPVVITLGLHRLEKMLKMAEVINGLWPCQLTANVMSCGGTKSTWFRMILMFLLDMWHSCYMRLIRKYHHDSTCRWQSPKLPAFHYMYYKSKDMDGKSGLENQISNIFNLPCSLCSGLSYFFTA